MGLRGLLEGHPPDSHLVVPWIQGFGSGFTGL